ncbi:cupin domain-containing protein [Cellulosimicrobium sp. CUA-896]|uniref:cupin domain-containing protein n=1 Tax=Cellulosimicrobium sp. CUA-896 TaxID=1517881 RepID=UPI00095F0C04|nr:cupin domain-containing protein [Cellulosimicrobium sp. CUA-896]OLT47894.1 cupin [Cellulosimicrobium sp. CUA-896]
MQDLTTDRSAAVPPDAARYVETLRVPAMSVGTYVIPAGAHDPQGPHREDEVYVVLAGRGRLWTPTRTVDAVAGSVLFVPAGEEHRFVDVVEDLTVVVVFAPAETRPGDAS